MKKRILILGGGISGERSISLKTAKAVKNCIKKKYNCKIVEPDENLTKNIDRFSPHVVFNALHGRFGEDGFIQTYLESKGVSYTHSGVLSSMMAMDKEISKKLFIKNKILTPKFQKIRTNLKKKEIKLLKKKIKFPVVIKPINEGSSLGVYICNEKNIINNLKKLKAYDEVLVEEFIPGREIQVAILDKKKLGAIELKPKRKFYDYKAKYSSKAKTKHIIPVDIKTKEYKNVMNIALKAHKILKCRGVTRSDFRFNNGKFYLLELNTQPGMTNLSLVPEIALHHGINFFSLIDWIIKDASKNR
ncbi:D-alanine--D-alanine ligase [Candidatus Pelagibacter sp.]|nr:D-alanine--D-alanine ligase [Candidatus Pelagibacter sp.]